MPTTSRIQIPREFICPIMRDVITDPVKTIFIEDSSHTRPSFLSRIFTNFSAKDSTSCEDHFFERLALDSWLGQNPNCPICKHRIKKAVPDTKKAKAIQNQFVTLSEKNKKHFQKAKAEVARVYGEQNQTTVRVSRVRPVDRTSQITSDLFSHRTFHSPNSFFKTAHPIVVSPYSMYKNVLQLINNGNLIAATRKANGIINSNYRMLSYQKLAEKHLSYSYPRFNCSRVRLDIQKALDLIKEITDRQIKNDLYFRIVKRASEYDLLQLAERIGNLISGNTELKNQSFKEIANRYLIKFQSNLAETTAQNVVRIANLITDAQIEEHLLNNLIKILIQNNNLKKALILATKISNVPTRDLLYINISQKYDLNKAYILSLKTTAKISSFSKRLKLYPKTALKMIIFAFHKVFTLFSKCATWGYHILLFPFRLFSKLKIYFQKK